MGGGSACEMFAILAEDGLSWRRLQRIGMPLHMRSLSTRVYRQPGSLWQSSKP